MPIRFPLSAWLCVGMRDLKNEEEGEIGSSLALSLNVPGLKYFTFSSACHLFCMEIFL